MPRPLTLLVISTLLIIAPASAGDADKEKIAELERRVAALEQAMIAIQAKQAAQPAQPIQPPQAAPDNKPTAVEKLYTEASVKEDTRFSASLDMLDSYSSEIGLQKGDLVLIQRTQYQGNTTNLVSFVFILSGQKKGLEGWVHLPDLKETGVLKPIPATAVLFAEDIKALEHAIALIRASLEKAQTISEISKDGSVLKFANGASLLVPSSVRKDVTQWAVGDRLCVTASGASSGSLWEVANTQVEANSGKRKSFAVNRSQYTDALVELGRAHSSVSAKLSELTKRSGK